MLLLGPLWMGILLDDAPQRNWKLFATAFALTVPFLFLWAIMLTRKEHERVLVKLFFAKEGFVVFPLVSTVLCYWLIDNPRLFSLSVYPLWLYLPMGAAVLLIKGRSLRKRPCTKPKFQSCINAKKFQLFPKLLARVAAEGSFPSGDAAGGMAFAIPIALAGRSEVGGLLMFLVCTGRVYFLAHHVFDTIAGSFMTFLIHSILCDVMGFGLGDLTWKHITAMVMGFVAFATVFAKALKHQ